MNYESENRRLIARCALSMARKGDFEGLERVLHCLANPHDAINATAANCALQGDFEFLLLQLRFGEASPEVMALAADIIEGKVKRAKGKPQGKRALRAGAGRGAARSEAGAAGWGKRKRTAVVAQVAEEFGMSKTAVQAALAAGMSHLAHREAPRAERRLGQRVASRK